MSPLILAMAIFALGWRLRAVERPRYSDRGTADGIGAGGVLYLVGMVALVAARYFGVLT